MRGEKGRVKLNKIIRITKCFFFFFLALTCTPHYLQRLSESRLEKSQSYLQCFQRTQMKGWWLKFLPSTVTDNK